MTTAAATKNFEITFRDNNTGRQSSYPAVGEAIEDVLMKALRTAGAWNWTVVAIGEID
jgi:hypothetical protein